MKYITLNSATLPDLADVANDLTKIKDLHEITDLVIDDVIVHLRGEIAKGKLYNIPEITTTQNLHIDNINLILHPDPQGNYSVLSFATFLVKLVNDIKSDTDFNIETMTDKFLNKHLSEYALI